MSGENTGQHVATGTLTKAKRTISVESASGALLQALSRLPSHAPFVAMKPCLDACEALKDGLVLAAGHDPQLSPLDRGHIANSLIDIEGAVKQSRDRLEKVSYSASAALGSESIATILECKRFLHLMQLIREYRKTGTKPSINPETRKHAAVAVATELQRFVVNGRVPIGICEQLVRASAWWYEHPSGPVRAPKHSDRLDNGMYGWQVEFGANAFLVETAIARCVRRVLQAVKAAQTQNAIENANAFRSSLELCVRSSVVNFEGVEYQSPYPSCHGYMHFGTQAISVEDFVQEIWNRTKAYMVSE